MRPYKIAELADFDTNEQYKESYHKFKIFLSNGHIQNLKNLLE